MSCSINAMATILPFTFFRIIKCQVKQVENENEWANKKIPIVIKIRAETHFRVEVINLLFASLSELNRFIQAKNAIQLQKFHGLWFKADTRWYRRDENKLMKNVEKFFCT